MRRILIVAACVASLAACHKEPTFDERYDTARETIGQRAKEIDAQISGTPPAEADGKGAR